MKTTIETKTAGAITINSEYLGNKPANWADSKNQNYHNHTLNVSSNGKRFSFDFWGSIASPEIKNDEENVFSFYCALSDGISAKESFEYFCSEFGYDTDSRKAEKIYKQCEKTLSKLERVFNCDLYDLINEIQDTYNC